MIGCIMVISRWVQIELKIPPLVLMITGHCSRWILLRTSTRQEKGHVNLCAWKSVTIYLQCNFVDDWRIVLGREHDVCSRIFRLAAICCNGNHGVKSVIERFWSSRKWITRIFNVKFGAIWLALKFSDWYSAILWGAFSLILLPVSTETSTSEMSYEYAIYICMCAI